MRIKGIGVGFALLMSWFMAMGQESYMIFGVQGDVMLFRKGTRHKQPRGEMFLAGDTLKIEEGQVVLLDRENRRVLLSQKGRFGYRPVAEAFKNARASLGNRYLVYLWEKMTDQPAPTSRKGGVIRGEDLFLFPPDSGIVFSDTLYFKYLNEEGIRWTLEIRSGSGDFISSYSSAGTSILLSGKELSWWKPAWFQWVLLVPGETPDGPHPFRVADQEGRDRFLKEWKLVRETVAELPGPLQESTLREILECNRWVP